VRSEPAVRILMISDKSLFGEGLCSLLTQQSGFQVIGHLLDVRVVPPYLELLRPDVLILDCPDEEGDPLAVLMRCLHEGWVQKIITVSRQDNSLCIITGQGHTVEEVGNLVEAVTGVARGLEP
jgi:DNA-binding NarL/FixJ family response regulator